MYRKRKKRQNFPDGNELVCSPIMGVVIKFDSNDKIASERQTQNKTVAEGYSNVAYLVKLPNPVDAKAAIVTRA